MSELRLNRWYLDEDNDQRFEVIDLKEDYVVVQHVDGYVQEFSIEDWEQSAFTAISAPEDWELSWGFNEFSDDLEDRFEAPKRIVRAAKEEETDDLEDFSFSDDLEDGQDFEAN